MKIEKVRFQEEIKIEKSKRVEENEN